ncbi:MAG: bile acid:sodium symporter [archaeon]|nr:bile acid:sodium symporter [archaeon]
MNLADYLNKYFIIVFLIAMGIGFNFPQLSGFSFATTFLIAFSLFLASLKVDFDIFLSHLSNLKNIIPKLFAMKIILPLLVFFATMLIIPQFALGGLLIAAMPCGMPNIVFADIFKGNKELSLFYTILAHIVSPITIPLLVFIVSAQNVSFDYIGLFSTLLVIVILPFVLAFLVQKFFRTATQKVSKYLSGANILLVAVIIAIIIAQNSEKFSSIEALLIPVIYAFGLLFVLCFYGLLLARKESKENKIAVSLSAIHPNFALALGIANQYFSFQELSVLLAGMITVTVFWIFYKKIIDRVK